MELFAQFGITKMNLSPILVYVLGDVLLRAPHFIHDTILLNTVIVSKPLNVAPFVIQYDGDQLFGPIVRGMRVELPEDDIQLSRVSRFLPLFSLLESRLLFDGEGVSPTTQCQKCALQRPRRTGSRIIRVFQNTCAFGKYHRHHRSRYVNKYMEGCQICQKKKDVRTKKQVPPTPFDAPTRRLS